MGVRILVKLGIPHVVEAYDDWFCTLHVALDIPTDPGAPGFDAQALDKVRRQVARTFTPDGYFRATFEYWAPRATTVV